MSHHDEPSGEEPKQDAEPWQRQLVWTKSGRFRVAFLSGLAGLVFACGRAETRQVGGNLPPVDTTSAGGFIAVPGANSSSSGSGGTEVVVEDPNAPCDTGISVSTKDPVDAAAAMELCNISGGDDAWGLVSARWTYANGDAAPVGDSEYDVGHGVLRNFGKNIKPLAGERLLVLSSGTARDPGDSGFYTPAGFDKGYVSVSPDGYPKESDACPGVTTGAVHDDVALEVVLLSPENAASFAFDFNFFTYEWPVYVCSPFNDFFVTFMDPAIEGQPDGNISFDLKGNPVSVNNALVQACDCEEGPPCDAPPSNPLLSFDCDLGDSQLDGTGFEETAATGWLVTRAPVEPGTIITLRFAVYDSTDGVLDSTTILDNFRWLEGETDGPVTTPELN